MKLQDALTQLFGEKHPVTASLLKEQDKARREALLRAGLRMLELDLFIESQKLAVCVQYMLRNQRVHDLRVSLPTLSKRRALIEGVRTALRLAPERFPTPYGAEAVARAVLHGGGNVPAAHALAVQEEQRFADAGPANLQRVQLVPPVDRATSLRFADEALHVTRQEVRQQQRCALQEMRRTLECIMKS